ncbi:MAG TPA: OmpA family protein [Gemmatimonadales bacterium]|nr:OmpA family protein [Gemmatimonadales bacterium]
MRSLLVPVAAISAVLVTACHHPAPVQVSAQPQVDSTAALRARQDSIAQAEAAARARAEAAREDSLATARRHSDELKDQLAMLLHFNFNNAEVLPADQTLLDQKIPILQSNSQVHIQIAGNCDERGSEEYNLALGNRRAMAARRYLIDHGIDSTRIEIVSYGKERPIDPGHDEKAWAMDRNDQFQILPKDVALR